jgi:PAS domain S-box-containing protein
VTSSASPDLALRIAQALLETRSDAILAADGQGVIRFWNPGAERIFGFSSEEALGRSLDIIIPETLRLRHWEGWSRAIETGRSRYGAGELLSVPAMTADGRRISVEFTIVMLHDADGRVDGVAAILRDVTPRFEELRSLRRELASRPPSSETKASGT